MSRSNSREEEAVGRVHFPTNVPISSTVNVVAMKDRTPTSSALYGTHDVVIKAKTGMPTVGDDGGGAEGAFVMPESPKNLELDALEVGVGSDELGFSNETAGDT